MKAKGDCYEANGRHFMDIPTYEAEDWRLVHGTVSGREGSPVEGIRFGHAWLECTVVLAVPRLRGEDVSFTMVHDFSNGKAIELPADLYYRLGEIDPSVVRRYTQTEVAVNILRREHWGPWD